MKYRMFQHVVLARDLPEKRLKRGDLAVVVEYHPLAGGEDGYSLEVFNALGETLTVVVVPESALEQVRPDEVLQVRSLNLVS
ncbi:MAG: DUF4926 domain-containing protein [Candidatus Tectomicrobia bacterium]|uniref:DUF4926 domain-containing protein n=1 Tax=Tectimicrobiota bacterium TaxID=2528274 RepID=A0A932CNP6_UNCTE|nr:DUF4926 domain-containing protein [Candidatus Tectomicrobia bacterium]